MALVNKIFTWRKPSCLNLSCWTHGGSRGLFGHFKGFIRSTRTWKPARVFFCQLDVKSNWRVKSGPTCTAWLLKDWLTDLQCFPLCACWCGWPFKMVYPKWELNHGLCGVKGFIIELSLELDTSETSGIFKISTNWRGHEHLKISIVAWFCRKKVDLPHQMAL